MKLDKHPDTTSPRQVDLVIFFPPFLYRPYHNSDISVRAHAPSSSSSSAPRPIVRITTRIRTTHVHPCDRPRSTNAGRVYLPRGEKVKERGARGPCGVERCTGDATRSPPLLPLPPLVQADGTKSIMYKDVKRNGSEMPDGVRMNGEDGGG